MTGDCTVRLLFLLLTAFRTTLVVPYVIHEARSDLFPADTSILQAYQDAQEIACIVVGCWRSGRELPLALPVFEERRLWSTAAVPAVAGMWFQGFSLGGIVGPFLMNMRPATLAVIGGLFAFCLYSCTQVQVTHDLSPQTVGTIRLFSALQLAAAFAGFFTARSFRRITV